MEKEAFLTIGRPQRNCCNCGAPIDTVTHHPSAIRNAQTQTLERLDYCAECWDYIKSEAYDSFWITHREKKKPRKLNRRQRAIALRALFESLWEKRDQEEVNVEQHLFFLAHLLMKWGGFKWQSSRRCEDGSELIIFEDPSTGDTLEVLSVETNDEQLLEIKQRIEEFLQDYAQEGETVTL